MTKIVVTLRIMPESSDVNLDELSEECIEEINKFTNETEIKQEIEPVAFGLKAIKLMFVMDENLGSTEDLENNINNLNGVSSVQVTDVRRAIG